MSTRAILYGTLGCHLCDEARDLILPIAADAGVALDEVDIAGDDTLEAAYGLRIPVLKCMDRETELNWPFAAEDVAALFRGLC